MTPLAVLDHARRRPRALAAAAAAGALLAALLGAAAASAGAGGPRAGPDADRTLRELVGQRLVVAVHGTGPSPGILARIRRGEVGGIILFGGAVGRSSSLDDRARAGDAGGGSPRRPCGRHHAACGRSERRPRPVLDVPVPGSFMAAEHCTFSRSAVVLEPCLAELERDLRPFRRAVAAGIPLVMLSNASYAAFGSAPAAWPAPIQSRRSLVREASGGRISRTSLAAATSAFSPSSSASAELRYPPATSSGG